MIARTLYPVLLSHLHSSQKGILLYGPRQSGKTTLMRQLIDALGVKTALFDADARGPWWEALVSRELEAIGRVIAPYDLLCFDEAQRIPEAGLILKIIRDVFPQKRLIVTGSSSLDLASRVSEPLTGRMYSFKLFPISQSELRHIHTPLESQEKLEERLIYGSYPEIFSYKGNEEKSAYLTNLINGYLYKDMLEFGGLRNANKIINLLKLLSFQIGSQVSIQEISVSLELNRGTVERYIDLLEKSFVIFRVSGFSRNLRTEIRKMDKVYFLDTGVRNALIGNMNALSNRDDGGRLWENFLMVERRKHLAYAHALYTQYFWRTHNGAELDLIEERDGKLYGFEFKFSHKAPRAPSSFLAAYPGAVYSVVNKDTWQDFV